MSVDMIEQFSTYTNLWPDRGPAGHQVDRYILDISKDKIKAAKIAHHYTKFNLLYKNFKTNQNPKFFYC